MVGYVRGTVAISFVLYDSAHVRFGRATRATTAFISHPTITVAHFQYIVGTFDCRRQPNDPDGAEQLQEHQQK